MKTCVLVWQQVAEFLLKLEMLQVEVVGKIKTRTSYDQ